MGYQIPGGPTAWRRFLFNPRLRAPWRSRSVPRPPRAPLTKSRSSRSAFPDLDAALQRQLADQQQMRRAVASVATRRKQLELQVAELEQTGHDAAERLADLRRQYSAIQAEEQRLSAAGRHLQVKFDAFRAAKKAVEAAYTATEEAAEAAWAEVNGKAGADADSRSSPSDHQS